MEVGKGEDEHVLDQFPFRCQGIVVLARGGQPPAIRRLARLEIGVFGIRLIRLEAWCSEEDVGLPAVVLGEKELPLRVGGAHLPRGIAVRLEGGYRAQRRGVLLPRERSAELADQEDHGVAVLDVVP